MIEMAQSAKGARGSVRGADKGDKDDLRVGLSANRSAIEDVRALDKTDIVLQRTLSFDAADDAMNWHSGAAWDDVRIIFDPA